MCLLSALPFLVSQTKAMLLCTPCLTLQPHHVRRAIKSSSRYDVLYTVAESHLVLGESGPVPAPLTWGYMQHSIGGATSANHGPKWVIVYTYQGRPGRVWKGDTASCICRYLSQPLQVCCKHQQTVRTRRPPSLLQTAQTRPLCQYLGGE